jgi:hypothetical protein
MPVLNYAFSDRLTEMSLQGNDRWYRYPSFYIDVLFDDSEISLWHVVNVVYLGRNGV